MVREIAKTVQKRYVVTNETFIINFGKYKGKSVQYLLENDPNYILWAQQNVSYLYFDKSILEQIGPVDKKHCLYVFMVYPKKQANRNKNDRFIKIGITSMKHVRERFSVKYVDSMSHYYDRKIMWSITYPSRKILHEAEQQVHFDLKAFGLQKKPNKYFSGHSECYFDTEKTRKIILETIADVSMFYGVRTPWTKRIESHLNK